jgi:hypothetical protein
MRLSPIDWPCPKMVGCIFLTAESYGVIPFGPSKDQKMAKHSVLYEMVGKNERQMGNVLVSKTCSG